MACFGSTPTIEHARYSRLRESCSFDSQLEHIRHFLQLDRPLATSPVDDCDTEGGFPLPLSNNDEYCVKVKKIPDSDRKVDPSELRSNLAHSKPLKPSLISGKPNHKSPTYKELVDKFCFGSPV